jgi:hypothetical protein
LHATTGDLMASNIDIQDILWLRAGGTWAAAYLISYAFWIDKIFSSGSDDGDRSGPWNNGNF